MRNREENYAWASRAIEVLSCIDVEVGVEDDLKVLLGWQKAMYHYEEILNANAPAAVNAWRGNF